MKKQPKALRAIALLEASKGALAIIVGLSLHELGGREIQSLFEELVQHLHLNPASEYPSVIHHAIAKINDKNIAIIALGSLLYASVRFVEAFGLWRGYAWTEWFALASGAIYLPFEIYGVVTQDRLLDWLALVINLIVIGYMALLIQRRRKEKSAVHLS
ncbi:DUF2127 domain-containing protein [Enterovibrio calviensis]|uniref:DUF2127 domain-containing protein n=1 Tax=Enterovibrio calviensis TaxID=91359 RepID=UPI0037364E82